MTTIRLTYFLSHPIQYQTPLIQHLAARDDIDLEVVYFSGSKQAAFDKQFNREVKWDIPLLEGYRYRFLRNYALNPTVDSDSFWGLVNLGVIGYIIREKPQVVLVNGWGYFSYLLVFLVSFLSKSKLIVRGESPLKQERKTKGISFYLKRMLLKMVSAFPYIGKQNKAFYESFGIREDQLFFSPYSVDKRRFLSDIESISQSELDQIRDQLNIPKENRIGIFCGKLIHKKRPYDLIAAMKETHASNYEIIIVGTGELEESLKRQAKELEVNSIHFLGFQNQSQLSKYYLLADFMILPSSFGETWGLVINEAMIHKLPALVSDHVGATDDLILEGQTGFTYPCGEIDKLAALIDLMVEMEDDELERLKTQAFMHVSTYSIEKSADGIAKAAKAAFH